MTGPNRIAVLGAGHVGPVIARLAVKAGYPVAIATSGDPENIALITELMIPGAQPRWASDAVADADIVVLAVPLHRFGEIDPGLLRGKLVVDAMNYWPASDGTLQAFEHGGSSEIVARLLTGSTGSTVVKALNHIGYHELEDRARPPGDPDRRAVGVAGDDAATALAIIGGPPARFAAYSQLFQRALGPDARTAHDQHRALRPQGHPPRPRTARLNRRIAAGGRDMIAEPPVQDRVRSTERRRSLTLFTIP
jgi:predicted dinucleotide-binding enzyme